MSMLGSLMFLHSYAEKFARLEGYIAISDVKNLAERRNHVTSLYRGEATTPSSTEPQIDASGPETFIHFPLFPFINLCELAALGSGSVRIHTDHFVWRD